MGVVWCNQHRAKLAVVLVFVSSIIICIPNSINITVYSQTPFDEGQHEGHHQLAVNSTPLPLPDNYTAAAEVWMVGFKMDTDIDRFIHSMNFWIHAIARLGPCLVLTLLSALLVRTMKLADARLRFLEGGSTVQRMRRQRATNRTTRMLLAIVILFLITELPQGIVMILSGMSPQFTSGIYLNLGDLFDILALVNSAVNFVLFCTMSRQFRKTFVAVFCRRRQTTVYSRSGRMYDEHNC